MVAAYIWMLRRRRRYAVRYSSLSLIRAAMPKHSRWRRHLPVALFLIGITGLVIALARPMAVIAVPYDRATVILALDVSGSMCATDIAPNRFSAAQEAAKEFVLNQEPGTQIGIVAFAGFAELVMPPTHDQEALIQAIDGLTRARRTAIGSAILRSIDAIAEMNPDVAPVNMGRSADDIAPTPVPEGLYQSDIIVLLTDGSNNQGALPLDAARTRSRTGRAGSTRSGLGPRRKIHRASVRRNRMAVRRSSSRAKETSGAALLAVDSAVAGACPG